MSQAYIIFGIVWSLAFTTLGQNALPQMRLERALENARSVTNVEIHYDDVLWIRGCPENTPITNDFIRTSHNVYMASNEKYRIECRDESPQTNINKLSETAFDGKTFYSYDGGNWMVEQNGDRPNDLENPLNPLVQPFFFLSRFSDDCLPGLRFVDLRSPDGLNGLVLPDAIGSNGMVSLSFPGLPYNGVNQLWNITIDDYGPDFKPSRISQTIFPGGVAPNGFETTYMLSDYTNLGAYHFPTKVTYTGFYVPTNKLLIPTIMSTGMVMLVSVKTPTQIPDSTFRLSESLAPRIWNWSEFKGYGVGLILGEDGSNIVVRRIVGDSTAGRQNELHAGDRILSIASSPVHAGKADLPRASILLRGAKGTAVHLTFIPEGKDDLQKRSITLVRGEVRERLSDGRLLTNGMKAPNLEMVVLTNRLSEHLSDYAGKIVVVEFWASWCSPCQKAMADLQLDPARYPNWKDKVVLIAASVDDTPDIAAKHVQKKGWNQTHNVWLKTKDIKSYHVGGIPAAYIIDAKGTISASGIADSPGLNIPDIVNKCLDSAVK